MAFDRSKHHRRSIRLKGYEYRRPGLYFVTICIQGGRNLLGDIVEEEMVLNAAGRLISDEWQDLPKRFPQIDLDAFAVLPNHMHGIIIITEDPVGATLVAAQGADEDGGAVAEDGTPEKDAAKSAGARATTRDAPTKGGRSGRGATLGQIVGAYKSITTNGYIRGVKTDEWKPFDGRFWQRNYHEHIIRNEQSLNTIRQYVENNPAGWKQDKFFSTGRWGHIS